LRRASRTPGGGKIEEHCFACRKLFADKARLVVTGSGKTDGWEKGAGGPQNQKITT
jgi:hypothetical protein